MLPHITVRPSFAQRGVARWRNGIGAEFGATAPPFGQPPCRPTPDVVRLQFRLPWLQRRADSRGVPNPAHILPPHRCLRTASMVAGNDAIGRVVDTTAKFARKKDNVRVPPSGDRVSPAVELNQAATNAGRPLTNNHTPVTAVNYRSVRLSSAIQNESTLGKVTALVSTRGDRFRFRRFEPRRICRPRCGRRCSLKQFSIALVAVLFA